jgi:glycosyltransferase involved in cell wall biosynthesis
MKAEDEMKVVNLFAQTFDPYDGSGRIACELVAHLSASGVHVNTFTRGERLFDTQSEPLRQLLDRHIKPTLGGIVLGYPTTYHEFGPMATSGPLLALTMFESTKLPKGWVEALNRCAAVSTPSRFCADVFEAEGVKVPVRVHPLGISEVFQYIQRPERKPFTFLALADRFRRKGWDAAVLAFNQAFGENPKYRLILKARESGMAFDIEHPCIEIIRRDMTEYELRDLYYRADAFVFPSRGEGFGLPPREAAATGLPVITTEWSGLVDDLSAWGYPVRYTLTPAWTGHETLHDLGEWAEPDRDHLVEQMRYVASGNPYVRGMAQHSARRIRNLYRWERFAGQVWETWEKECITPVTPRRKKWKEKQRDHIHPTG